MTQAAQFVGDFTSVTSRVIEPPHTLRQPVWPRPILTLTLAMVIGCMLGVGAIFSSTASTSGFTPSLSFARRWACRCSAKFVRCPRISSPSSAPIGLICHSKPRSNWAEAFRAVRTDVDFLRRNRRLEVVMVTSPYAGDGKSTSSSNLAISFAYAGRRVLLVDCDLHRPHSDKLYDLNREHGLSHLLKDLMPLEQVVQRTTIDNLDVITAGPEVDNPAELLSSPRLKELLDEFRQSYEVIILDAPPVLAVTDPAIVGAVADGIVVVVHASTLRHHDTARTGSSSTTWEPPCSG